MTRQPDPVFSGLAIGLKPADIDMPADTISLTDEQLETLRASERIRTVRATERLAYLAEKSLAAQLRTARAAERQAEALEIIAALFASVVGTRQCGLYRRDGTHHDPRCEFHPHRNRPQGFPLRQQLAGKRKRFRLRALAGGSRALSRPRGIWSFRTARALPFWGIMMSEIELLAQAAASAASTPSFPLMIELAKIGFEAVQNARAQRVSGEYEIERAFKRKSALMS